MAPRTKSQSSDRRRVSAQPHEIKHAASRIAKSGPRRGKATAAVRRAKAQLGRKTRRPAVMSRARAIARRG